MSRIVTVPYTITLSETRPTFESLHELFGLPVLTRSCSDTSPSLKRTNCRQAVCLLYCRFPVSPVDHFCGLRRGFAKFVAK